jgi:hypothetical protein
VPARRGAAIPILKACQPIRDQILHVIALLDTPTFVPNVVMEETSQGFIGSQ